MHYENIPTVRLLIIAEIYGLTAAELRAAFKLQNTSQETVDHAPAAGFSFDFFGAAPTGSTLDLAQCAEAEVVVKDGKVVEWEGSRGRR